MPKLRNMDVIQDGSTFYMHHPAGGRASVTAPIKVRHDYDTGRASAARRWFTQTYCPRFHINPQFI